MTYIDEILNEVLAAANAASSMGPSGLHLFDLLKAAGEEIEKLEVLDFPPDKRFQFVALRTHYRKLGRLGSYTSENVKNFVKLTIELKAVVAAYGSFGSQINPRLFKFLQDADLKNIIVRDYAEFNNILIPDGAWKSSVVLAGSILEAVLYDVLENSKYYGAAMMSSKAPKNTAGTIDLKRKEWKLINLIEVGVDIGAIPTQKANSIDQILRDYRNFVHPKKELRTQYPCTEAEAFLAKGALDSILNHFEVTFP